MSNSNISLIIFTDSSPQKVEYFLSNYRKSVKSNIFIVYKNSRIFSFLNNLPTTIFYGILFYGFFSLLYLLGLRQTFIFAVVFSNYFIMLSGYFASLFSTKYYVIFNTAYYLLFPILLFIYLLFLMMTYSSLRFILAGRRTKVLFLNENVSKMFFYQIKRILCEFLLTDKFIIIFVLLVIVGALTLPLFPVRPLLDTLIAIGYFFLCLAILLKTIKYFKES